MSSQRLNGEPGRGSYRELLLPVPAAHQPYNDALSTHSSACRERHGPTVQCTDGHTADAFRYFEASALAEDLGLTLSGPALNAAIPKLDPGRTGEIRFADFEEWCVRSLRLCTPRRRASHLMPELS